MKQFYSARSENSNNGPFKTTNFILKPEAAKQWATYTVSGKTCYKPYPVLDAQGVPCPPRLVSRFEANGEVADADALTKEEIREYECAVIPDAFIQIPIVMWVGREGVQFVDQCSDIDQYRLADEPSEVVPPTPYLTMARKLLRLVPTDNNKVNPADCPPLLLKTRRIGKGVLSLRYPQTAIVFRAAMSMHKGEELQTKYAVDGVLFRTVAIVPQASARNAFRNQFFVKTDPMKPISADNFPFSAMFHPMGTQLLFSKSDATNSQSPVQVTAVYDKNFNEKLVKYFDAENVDQYWSKVRDEFGAFNKVEDMLRFMTVQEQLDLLIEQFPAAWVWYGLRDSRYADLVPEKVREEAKQDPEWAEKFGISQVVNTKPAEDAVPMSNFQELPKVSGSFNVQQVMKEAEVTYKPESKPQDATAQRILDRWGVK